MKLLKILLKIPVVQRRLLGSLIIKKRVWKIARIGLWWRTNSAGLRIGSPNRSKLQQAVEIPCVRSLALKGIISSNPFDVLAAKSSTNICPGISTEVQVEVSTKAKASQTNEMEFAIVEDDPTMHISNPETAKALKEDQVARMINSSPVINPLIVTLKTSAQHIPTQSFEALGEQQDESPSWADWIEQEAQAYSKSGDLGGSCVEQKDLDKLNGDDMFDGDDEDVMLDICFDKVDKDGDLSPRQQRSGSNKSKKKTHGRQHSWDGKVTEEFVPRHLSMRLAKQNHMTVSTTSTRSNKSKK
ncbi:hypothetical protein K7X08_032011 [Anisodus acutangulus]|uniref:NB-ARC domain containing protein n=1 Tax=Anisodus acutangulus TaxID=402998 RepID=A0A9Q1MN92_9SOLA|nr:hypothetical protein K7X08_032011 [Anisodus acutangulus]